MRRGVAVVIPALNEERWIGSAITSSRCAGASEIVVVDGGSNDGTVAVAIESGATVIAGEPIRGRQLNAGAAATGSEILLFLHADTMLPDDAVEAIESARGDGVVFGGFRLRFHEQSLRLRIAAAMINLRGVFTRAPWGDQAQWITREAFDQTGGFLEQPIMEDYEMAARMKRRGRVRILSPFVSTSGRRFRSKGVLKTAYINWKVILLWRLGTSPERLAEIYRSTPEE